MSGYLSYYECKLLRDEGLLLIGPSGYYVDGKLYKPGSVIAMDSQPEIVPAWTEDDLKPEVEKIDQSIEFMSQYPSDFPSKYVNTLKHKVDRILVVRNLI